MLWELVHLAPILRASLPSHTASGGAIAHLDYIRSAEADFGCPANDCTWSNESVRLRRNIVMDDLLLLDDRRLITGSDLLRLLDTLPTARIRAQVTYLPYMATRSTRLLIR